MEFDKSDFRRLLDIMNELRVQCPWDRKQTIHTLRQQSIEELYELTDAISDENWEGICEESGDLLLHIVFYAKIASEKGKFSIDDVIEGICDKLISRHPHIYGDVKVKDEEEVKRNWEELKLKEGKKSVLQGVPKAMPALMKAIRIQEKVKKIGFDWEKASQVKDKVREEKQELEEAVSADDKDAMEAEMGDYLFSLVNYSRFLGIDPQKALERTNRKFMHRFKKMEEYSTNENNPLSEMNLGEMDELWERAKENEN